MEVDISQGKPSSEALTEVLAILTTDQIRFVIARQEYSRDNKAAEAIGIKPATVARWKYDGVPIDKAVRLLTLDGLVVARELRRRSLPKAMAVKIAGLENDNDRLRQNVSTEIIEWEMGKATQKQEISGPDAGAFLINLTWGDEPDELNDADDDPQVATVTSGPE